MPPDAIVITLNVTEGFRASLFNRFENAAFDEFRLEPGKEAFRLGIIVAVSLGAHRLPQAVNIKKPSILNRRVLAAAISVNNRAVFYQAAPPRLKKSVNYQLRRHIWRDLSAGDSSRVFILKRRQITEFPVLKRQICNIADDQLSFLLQFVRRLQQIRIVSEVVF